MFSNGLSISNAIYASVAIGLSVILTCIWIKDARSKTRQMRRRLIAMLEREPGELASGILPFSLVRAFAVDSGAQFYDDDPGMILIPMQIDGAMHDVVVQENLKNGEAVVRVIGPSKADLF